MTIELGRKLKLLLIAFCVALVYYILRQKLHFGLPVYYTLGRKLLHFGLLLHLAVGGAVASWLAYSTPERTLRVRTLDGDIVLCSWADTLLSRCLSPPRCING